MNSSINSIFFDCKKEIDFLYAEINKLSNAGHNPSHLIDISIIYSSGALERIFKNIILEHLSKGCNNSSKTFLSKYFERGFNPKFNRIAQTVDCFDHNIAKALRSEYPKNSKHKSNLDSLISNRNAIAHGGSKSITISDVRSYFSSGIIIARFLFNQLK